MVLVMVVLVVLVVLVVAGHGRQLVVRERRAPIAMAVRDGRAVRIRLVGLMLVLVLLPLMGRLWSDIASRPR